VNAQHILLVTNIGIISCCLAVVLLIVLTKLRRTVRQTRTAAKIGPYRHALLAVATGEDDDGKGRRELYAISSRVWKHMDSAVVSMLSHVRGAPAEVLAGTLRGHGEIDRATAMTRSRSAVKRSRAAYLLGLVRDTASVPVLLPLLSDKSDEVRLVATRALGAIGEPSTAEAVIEALRIRRGRIGVPAWIAEEALLGMGVGIGPVLLKALKDDEHGIRNVAATVVGLGTYPSAAPELRQLLAYDLSSEVRRSAAVALGQVGGDGDVGAIGAHTGPGHPTPLRRICVEALGELGSPQALPKLRALLADDDRRLAEMAGESMVRIGDAGVTELRIAATGDDEGARIARAALDLARLRGPLPSVGEA